MLMISVWIVTSCRGLMLSYLNILYTSFDFFRALLDAGVCILVYILDLRGGGADASAYTGVGMPLYISNMRSTVDGGVEWTIERLRIISARFVSSSIVADVLGRPKFDSVFFLIGISSRRQADSGEETTVPLQGLASRHICVRVLPSNMALFRL